jgi:hypothetical protein
MLSGAIFKKSVSVKLAPNEKSKGNRALINRAQANHQKARESLGNPIFESI